MGWKPFKKLIDNRHEVKMAKVEAKTARVESRTDRAEAKAEAKKTAYEQGIDPNEAMWGGISSLGKSAVDAYTKGSPADRQGALPLNSPTMNQTSSPSVGGMSPMVLILIAVAALFMFGKK